MTESPSPHRSVQPSWWRALGLAGLDYFAPLGYQPGLAALAAGVLSPLAALVLVALALVGVLPVLRRLAPGPDPLARLERLLPNRFGPVAGLLGLGFAVTVLVLTVTLSTADVTAHLQADPLLRETLSGQRVLVTLMLIATLGLCFRAGFTGAVRVAVVLVPVYLTLNAVVVIVSLAHALAHPYALLNWRSLLTLRYPDIVAVGLVALLLFPRAAVGLIGFSTGGPVPGQGVRGTRRLLTVAVLTTGGFLVAAGFLTTVLVPPAELRSGGAANGRALAFLAQRYVGEGFGVVYDAGTALMLWFAAAAALAAVVRLVPRHLGRLGLDHRAGAVRPLALVAAAVLTVIFGAGVDAQGGAAAACVLFLLGSAAFTVTLDARRDGDRPAALGYGAVAVVLGYATIVAALAQPAGLAIAAAVTLTLIARARISSPSATPVGSV